MDSASHPPRPTTSAFAAQVTPMRPGPYNPRTPALTAEQARMMVQEEFGSDSYQTSPMTARSPTIQLPSQGTARTSPTFHTALEDVDIPDVETPSKKRRLDSKGKAREFPYEFDYGTHFLSSSSRTSNMPLLNRKTRSATEPQLEDGAAGHQQGSALLTENEILRQLLGEKEKENACLRRQIKLLKKLSKARTSDTHMVSFTSACSSMPLFHARVNRVPAAHPPRLPQRSRSISNKIQFHYHLMLRIKIAYIICNDKHTAATFLDYDE